MKGLAVFAAIMSLGALCMNWWYGPVINWERWLLSWLLLSIFVGAIWAAIGASSTESDDD